MMSLLLLVVMCVVGAIAFTVVSPWAGLELGFGLIGALGGIVLAVLGGAGALVGGLLVAGFAVFAAVGAALLALLLLPLVLILAVVFGLLPVLLPVVLLVGLIWLLVRAAQPAPALPAPTGTALALPRA